MNLQSLLGIEDKPLEQLLGVQEQETDLAKLLGMSDRTPV